MATPDGPPHDLPLLIEVLDRHEVDYLVVGGAAAYAYGAKRRTEDADCMARRERVNLEGLPPPCGSRTPGFEWAG